MISASVAPHPSQPPRLSLCLCCQIAPLGGDQDGSPTLSWAQQELLPTERPFSGKVHKGSTRSVWIVLSFLIKKFCQRLSLLRENIQSPKSTGSSGPAARSTFVLAENQLVSCTHMAAQSTPAHRPLLVPTGTAHMWYIDLFRQKSIHIKLR